MDWALYLNLNLTAREETVHHKRKNWEPIVVACDTPGLPSRRRLSRVERYVKEPSCGPGNP